ncbi:MAG: hypothetical protein ABW168_04725 [Sedimenticola sp.]
MKQNTCFLFHSAQEKPGQGGFDRVKGRQVEAFGTLLHIVIHLLMIIQHLYNNRYPHHNIALLQYDYIQKIQSLAGTGDK